MSDTQRRDEAPTQADHAPGEAAQGQNASETTGGTSARDNAAPVILCPFCHSRDVELLSLFGAQLLTDQYYCNACHTPFEHVRDSAG